MKLQLHINRKSLSAEYSTNSQTATLTTDSANYKADVVESQPDFFTVVMQGKVYACSLEKLPNGASEIHVNGKRVSIAIQDPKRLSQNAGAAGQAGGRATLTSPMPGKVVRVLCAVGDDVNEGQGILVVEAMKMQNEVQAPKAGKVTDLKVIEGQTVNAGEVMAVVE